MSITLVVGKPGAGKSLEAMSRHIVPAARGRKAVPGRRGTSGVPGIAPRHVVTNVPVIVERIERDYPETIGFIHVIGEDPAFVNPHSDPSSLKEWAEAFVNDDGIGPLFVWDEAHLVYAKSRFSQELLDFYTLHRHHAVDVVLITQQVSQLNANLARLAEIYIILKRDRNWGGGNDKYSRWTYDGYPKGALLKHEVGVRQDKRWFGTYRSTYSSSLQEATPKVRSIWLRLPFLATYAVAGVMAFVVVTVALPAVFRLVSPASSNDDIAAVPPIVEIPRSENSVPQPILTGIDSASSSLIPLIAPGLGQPAASAPVVPKWEVSGWMVYEKDGVLTCTARFGKGSERVSPALMKRREEWFSMSVEYDQEEGICILEVVEKEGDDPIVEMAEI